VLQTTPVQGGTATQTPLELQLLPAPHEFGLAVHLQTLFAVHVGVVAGQTGLQTNACPTSGVPASTLSAGGGQPVIASARTAPRHTHARFRTFIRDSLIA
jgi:hypothetical protein